MRPLVEDTDEKTEVNFQVAEQQSKTSAVETSKIRQNELWKHMGSFPLEQFLPNILLTFSIKLDYAAHVIQWSRIIQTIELIYFKEWILFWDFL